MSRIPGEPVRILFQEVTVATTLKARNESAEAASGGGARDIRLSPHDELLPFMERLLPKTRSKRRPGGKLVQIHWGAVTWGDGSHEEEIEYWPPTNARPREGRIARISALPPLVDPPSDLHGVVILFVQDDRGVVWVRYATSEGLEASMPQVGRPILDCIAKAKSSKIASGYIDLEPGGLGNWCNCKDEE